MDWFFQKGNQKVNLWRPRRYDTGLDIAILKDGIL